MASTALGGIFSTSRSRNISSHEDVDYTGPQAINLD